MGEVVQLPPRGHYLAGEVGRLAGVSGEKIGQWARYGYIQASQSKSGQSPLVYSFQDVAEAILVHDLYLNEISYEDIKEAIRWLRERYGDWPLQRAKLATMPGRVVAQEGEKVYDIGKLGWQQMDVEEHLKQVAGLLERGGWAARELPDLKYIEVNPERMSGRPTIRGRRLRADKVARLALSPGGRKTLKTDYELSEGEIEDARRWWKATEQYEAA